MFIFNPITLINWLPSGILPYLSVNNNTPLAAIVTNYPMLLGGLDFNNGQSVIGGIIIGVVVTCIPKIISFIKNRYDKSLKTSYDIDTLFDNYAEVMKAVDEGNESNKKILDKLDKGSTKMDSLIEANRQTRFVVQELSKVVHDHDEILYERKTGGGKNNKSNRIPRLKDDMDDDTKYW